MTMYRMRVCVLTFIGAIVLTIAAAGTSVAAPPGSSTIQLAQAGGTEPHELEPRYQPAPIEEKSWYNSSYIFALTRGVAGSTLVPAAKVPLYVFTVPLDVVLLPIAAIGGMFG